MFIIFLTYPKIRPSNLGSLLCLFPSLQANPRRSVHSTWTQVCGLTAGRHRWAFRPLGEESSRDEKRIGKDERSFVFLFCWLSWYVLIVLFWPIPWLWLASLLGKARPLVLQCYLRQLQESLGDSHRDEIGREGPDVIQRPDWFLIASECRNPQCHSSFCHNKFRLVQGS